MKTAPPRALLELQQWPRWVVWRTEERDGKPTKVPYDPHTWRRASSTDEETWATHEIAAKALERGRYDGIGYVFAPDDEYAGVDLDKCIEDGKVDPAAWKIVERLNSYTELSPTGTGLHVIVRGRINGDRKRTAKTDWGGDFESYDQARFFTVTGDRSHFAVASTPATIEARQQELDAIRTEIFHLDERRSAERQEREGPPYHVERSNGAGISSDVELLERIRKSKQGPKFTDLFDRGASEGQESEADLGLCNILAFWLGPDPARIDSWFRRSALMRGKWDDRRGETTYGGYTIDRALEGRTEFYDPSRRSRRARPDDDDVEQTPGEEMSGICGLIDDPFIHGWRPMRQAKGRVVLTTRSGLVLDLESWKAATSTPRTLAQEIRLQLGVDVSLTKEKVDRLDVLVGKFCELVETTTIKDRARELGEAILQTAESWPFVMDNDQKSRAVAFRKLQETHPATRVKAEGISLAEAIVVLSDTVTGKRYVRVQWFVDYVKANATSSTVGPILEQVEAPGWWSRPNSAGKFKATDPNTGRPIWHRLYEVPKDWEGGE